MPQVLASETPANLSEVEALVEATAKAVIAKAKADGWEVVEKEPRQRSFLLIDPGGATYSLGSFENNSDAEAQAWRRAARIVASVYGL
jgi:hypothetical protein